MGNAIAVQGRRTTVVVLYNGRTEALRYNEHETVHALLQQALATFGAAGNHLLALFMASGVELTNEQDSLEHAGVHAGDHLVLRQSIVKGG